LERKKDSKAYQFLLENQQGHIYRKGGRKGIPRLISGGVSKRGKRGGRERFEAGGWTWDSGGEKEENWDEALLGRLQKLWDKQTLEKKKDKKIASQIPNFSKRRKLRTKKGKSRSPGKSNLKRERGEKKVPSVIPRESSFYWVGWEG